MFQQDYIMRQVEMLTQIVAKVLGKETVEYEWEEEAQSAADHLYLRLMRLVEKRGGGGPAGCRRPVWFKAGIGKRIKRKEG